MLYEDTRPASLSRKFTRFYPCMRVPLWSGHQLLLRHYWAQLGYIYMLFMCFKNIQDPNLHLKLLSHSFKIATFFPLLRNILCIGEFSGEFFKTFESYHHWSISIELSCAQWYLKNNWSQISGEHSREKSGEFFFLIYYWSTWNHINIVHLNLIISQERAVLEYESDFRGIICVNWQNRSLGL